MRPFVSTSSDARARQSQRLLAPRVRLFVPSADQPVEPGGADDAKRRGAVASLDRRANRLRQRRRVLVERRERARLTKPERRVPALADRDSARHEVDAALGHERLRAVRVEPGILREDRALQAAETRSRLDAELVDEQSPALAEHRERLGLPPAAVEREHQRRAQLLAERSDRHEPRQLADDERVAAELELRSETALERGVPTFVELLRPGREHRRARHVCKRCTAPEGERLPQQRHPPRGGLSGGAATELVEPRRIDARPLDHQLVPAGRGRDGVVAEAATKLGDEDVERVARLGGRAAVPDALDQLVGRDPLADAKREQRQRCAGLRPVDVQLRPVSPGGDGAEQPDLERPGLVRIGTHRSNLIEEALSVH